MHDHVELAYALELTLVFDDYAPAGVTFTPNTPRTNGQAIVFNLPSEDTSAVVTATVSFPDDDGTITRPLRGAQPLTYFWDIVGSTTAKIEVQGGRSTRISGIKKDEAFSVRVTVRTGYGVSSACLVSATVSVP